MTLSITAVMLSEPVGWARKFVLVSFAFLVLAVLGADSVQMVAQGLDVGQPVANALVIPYFLVLLLALKPEQRLIALIFVPFSAVAEYIFSLVFGLYAYRLGAVPIYVPFGHAILFSTGLLLCELDWVKNHEDTLRPCLKGLFMLLFAGVILLLQDTLSAIFGLVFLWVLRRKGYQTLYFVMGLLVLYIELLGTGFGCWAWAAHPFGQSWLQATSPPFGAFVCYVLGDIGGFKIARFFQRQFSTDAGIERGVESLLKTPNQAAEL